jgi:hypothetical protein
MTDETEPMLTDLRKMFFRYLVIAMIAAVLVMAGWLTWHTFHVPTPDANAAPANAAPANVARIKVGTPFADVVSLLGDPGPSYSSDLSYQVYIWKYKTEWFSVRVENGKVTQCSFDQNHN